MAVGADADGQRPGTGGLEAGGAVAAAEAEQPQAGAVALLGMRAVGEDGGDERRGLGADGLRPLDEARRRPLEMVLVGLGHVGGGGGVPARRVIAPMGGDALAAMEELDGRRADARVHDLVDQGVGDGVVVAVNLDVVVDVDAGDRPLAVDERLGRQRPQRGPVQSLEELAAAGAVQAHGPRVQVGEELGDAGVEGRQGEEGLVAQPREDPPFGDQHAGLDLRLVAGLGRPRRQDGGAVVRRELFVGALQARLVAAGHHDAALELVAHDRGRDAAEKREGARVAGDPVGHLLGAGRLDVGVVRGPEDGGEELDLDDLAGGRIDESRLLAGVVDEALVAGTVELAHGQAPARRASGDRGRRTACTDSRRGTAPGIRGGAAPA